jgi:anti-anti-sigma factor
MANSVARLPLRVRRLDAASSRDLVELVDNHWRAGARTLALDLSGVEEIDSMGLSTLIHLNRRRPFGTRIVLCALNEYVRDVVEIAQLHYVFDVYDSSVAAEYALAG